MTIIILTTKTKNETQKEMRLGLECSGEDREQRRGGKKGSGDSEEKQCKLSRHTSEGVGEPQWSLRTE